MVKTHLPNVEIAARFVKWQVVRQCTGSLSLRESFGYAGAVARIDFVGVGHPKNVAKSLKRALAARSKEIGLLRCGEIFAKMTGYQNWHELQVVAAQTLVPSMKDLEVGEAETAACREQFASRLSELAQIDRAVADDIVDQISPTGARRKAEASPPAADFPAP